MWIQRRIHLQRNKRFFLIGLSHDNVYSIYEMNFTLMNDFKYSLKEIEDMIPFEREIYIALLQKSQNKKANELNK